MKQATDTTAKRLLSLDVFRGITIALMIIVNNQGDWSSVYPFLKHAAWHGWRGADIVFPFFLFAVGMSIPLAFSSKIEDGTPKKTLSLKILKRTGLLVLLGIILNLFPHFNFPSMRIPGVLQRIGLCYLLAALSFLYMKRSHQWIISLIILAGYGALLLFIPPPGSPAPGFAPAANWCLYLDRLILAGHTYAHAPVPGFDPEGILSTLPAAISAMTGIFTTHLLRSDIPEKMKTIRLVAAAITCTVAGLALDCWIPINKNLWTPSYVLFMTGLALALLSLLRWIIDSKGFSEWAMPFTVLGANALTAYILSSALGKFLAVTAMPGTAVTMKAMIYRNLYAPWLEPCAASLGYALGFLLLWVLAMAVLYRKKVFIKI